MRTLVIYCSHKINRELEFFLKYGYIKSPNIEFIICLNGDDFDIEKYNSQISNLGFDNLTYIKRENVGLDFGAWGEMLNRDVDGQKYYTYFDNFIFLNNTCCGPFLPVYEKRNWVEIFTSMLTDKIKLVGPTINYYNGKMHVQSYMMCTDKIGLQIGLDNGIFDIDRNLSKEGIIEKCEVGYSLLLYKNNYTIKSLLKGQEWLCGLTLDEILNSKNLYRLYSPHNCDMVYPDSYMSMMNIHPFEVIFFKSNRNITPHIIEKYIDIYEDLNKVRKL